ncbi:uncharacterized protein LOC106760216 [Vigna radiata var. radiata]|uniref:Uncharacterized protein LOC106760216 n=1 Tax=Vigna radiata var. radiata TaxID=3916 RepID=A0A1S3TZH7_VIGRR|nr:uncharacterized protein LOC106760216 [Vigna radiata var. radiata]
MVTTRNTTAEDPAEAIRALRQQMEDMRRQHEQELSAVREECAARIAREREIREKGILHPDGVSNGQQAIWCRAFSLSLEGEALEWFNALPAGSIQSFEGLKEMFGRQFAGSRAEDPTVFELSNLRQGKDETLKAFMDRYQKMVRRVKGLNVELALQYVMPALRPGPFKDSVCRKRPKTMEELRERAADEMRVEEMKQAYKKESQESKEKAEGKKPDGSSRMGGFKPREAPRGPKFQQYTPLNAPPARILQEALSVNLILPLKKRPTPAGADGNKHCLYHQNMGHTTEECVTLRD